MLRIDKIMKERGISTQMLAEKMDVTPQYVSEIVNERKNITLSGLTKFADALQVPMAALMDGYHDLNDMDYSFKCPYCGSIIMVRRE